MNNNQKGFTLIETTVTLLVFTISMVLVTAIFARAVEIERRVVWSQRVQENSTLIFEAMAKEIRVSKIVDQNALPPNCAPTLTMSHPIACNGSPCNITYSLNGTYLLKHMGYDSFVNSSDVKITSLRFCITGSGDNDNRSPKVTILMSLQSTGGSPPISADLETTVVSRDVNSELQNP